MTDEYSKGAQRLMRRFSRMTPAVRKAVGQEAFMQAEDMAAQMRRIAPYDPEPDDGEHVRDHIHVEDGRLGDISYVVISDAKDAEGRPKAARVELGHMAADGTEVQASPSFYPVVRASAKRVKRKLAGAARRAIRKEAGL
ncbi:MAG: HK97 gp10 family phage protein [Brevundimonas sp.]|uniref:HK97 gp10 family phage protein n=1 Tax=Brevundimonas sp. TaxID=1871086 RepID=UPI00403316BC